MAQRRGKATKSAKKRRPLKKAERRAQILDVARDVFNRFGYHQATIDHIVAEAGIARGTFYLYFEDKRDIFSELIDGFSSRLAAEIVRIVTDDPSKSVDSQVLENIRGVIGVCLRERAMTKMLFTDAVGIDPAFDRKLAAFYDEVVLLLTESLRDGQALGIVRDGEPRVLSYLTLGALKELLYQVVTLGLTDESTEVLTQQLFRFLKEGYLRDAPPPKRTRGRRTRSSGA